MRGHRNRRRRRRAPPTGARQKLDAVHLNGCLAFAALVGAMAGSSAAFLLAFAALMIGGVAGGDIRPRPRGR